MFSNDPQKVRLAELLTSTDLVHLELTHEFNTLAGHVLLDLLEERGLPTEEFDAVGALRAEVPLALAVMHAAVSRGLEINALVAEGQREGALTGTERIVVVSCEELEKPKRDSLLAKLHTAGVAEVSFTQLVGRGELSVFTPEDVTVTSGVDPDFDHWGNGEKPGGVAGVGPWAEEHPGVPVPVGEQYDAELLAAGDRRNVVDKYRYWTVDAIRADLARTHTALHIAIENLEHDLNIGSIVRSGNAFNVGGVHIIGKKRWNRRGALVTDRYMDVHHHADVASLVEWARANDYTLVAVDNMDGSQPIEAALEAGSALLPEHTLLIFGQESNGLTDELLEAADQAVYIPQFGSTRSMNVAAAAAIAIHVWVMKFGGGEEDRNLSVAKRPAISTE